MVNPKGDWMMSWRMGAAGTWMALTVVASLGCNASTTATGTANLDIGANVHGTATIDATASVDASADGGVSFDRAHNNVEAGEIHFKFDKATLEDDETSRTFDTLTRIAAFMKAHPAVKLTVEGHSDSRGSAEHNRDLSNRRAAAIVEWLATNGGIGRERLSSKGFGMDAPYVKGEPPECLGKKDAPDWCETRYWEPNRRTRLHVESGAETIAEPAAPAESPDTDRQSPSGGPRWVVALDTGVLFPSGETSSGTPVGDAVSFVVPIQAALGMWVIPKLALGIDARYGVAVADTDHLCAGQPCSASGHQLRLGIWGEYHPQPTAGFWLGLGLGWEQLTLTTSTAAGETSDTQQGLEFANVRIGYDWNVASWLRAGPLLTMSVGKYASASDLHEWFGAGIRGAHDF